MTRRTPLEITADSLLHEIGIMRAEVARLEAAAAQEVAQVRERWEEKSRPWRAQKERLERRLMELMKAERQAFFAAADKVTLPHGVLLHGWRESVVKARGVLEKLVALGWEEAIIRTPQVHWEVLEGWPEEKLFACGTRKQRKEFFGFEVTMDPTNAGGAGAAAGPPASDGPLDEAEMPPVRREF